MMFSPSIEGGEVVEPYGRTNPVSARAREVARKAAQKRLRDFRAEAAARLRWARACEAAGRVAPKGWE